MEAVIQATGHTNGRDTLTDKVIEELKNLYVYSTRQPGDVDVDQMVIAWKVSRDTARKRLNRLVETGKFVKVTLGRNRSDSVVYRKVGP